MDDVKLGDLLSLGSGTIWKIGEAYAFLVGDGDVAVGVEEAFGVLRSMNHPSCDMVQSQLSC